MQGAPTLLRGDLDLVELAEDVEFDLAALAEHHVAQVQVVDLGCKPVRGDYVSMREALRNLVINAILHHPNHAQVKILCGPGARISVEDNGRGIAVEQVDKLFEPFTRASSASEGAGLGLAVVQKVVELHCGTIAVKTSEMGGAAFIIVLFPGTGASRGPARAQVEVPKTIDQLAGAE
jgi:signal transduction histidine kinase